MKLHKLCTLTAALLLAAGPTLAKLPAPSDEAKAKAAEAAAKTTWSNQVANFQLCKSMDRVAASYFEQAKKQAKGVKPPATLPACADPGAFVYAAASSAPTTTPQGNTPATATAPPAAPVKK